MPSSPAEPSVALTREDALALAPDPASAKAGTKLANPSKWPLLGADNEAVWGHCQGSGAKPYVTLVDLSDRATKCSCPSRKFPCKHALALLLLRAEDPAGFTADRLPDVDMWLTTRRKKAEPKPVRPATPADKEAIAKRVAERWQRIAEGTEELQGWIADQFSRGFASVGHADWGDWERAQKRCVDSQAPGLGAYVARALSAIQARRFDEAAAQLGLAQLLIDAVHRRTELSPPRLADVRAALGWATDRDELSGTEEVHDLWWVLGERELGDGGLRERHVWLRGARTGRMALLLDFHHRQQTWERGWRFNSCYSMALTFYPGTAPLRAFAGEHLGPQTPQTPLNAPLAVAAVEAASTWFAANPWLPQVPLLIEDALLLGEQGGILQTPLGTFPLAASEEDLWDLLSLSGGGEMAVFGEWNGRQFLPLAAWSPDGTWHSRGDR